MHWLHLSDLHIGRNNSAQKTAMGSLVSAIREFSGPESVDLVLLTGDLAYSGQREEYDRLEQFLIRPLRELAILRDARIVAVPGNHDLDCGFGVPLSWQGLGTSRQQEFFSSSTMGRQLRSHRAEGFGEYERFAARCGVETCYPTKEPAKIVSVVGGSGKQLQIVCVNTAYFSDKEVKDEFLAPAPVEAIREILDTLDATQSAFVVGHHPIRWFLRETAHHFKTLLIQKNAIYLHGHLHEIEPVFGQKGLVSLGFGAGYLAPLNASAKPYYRNTFALCRLDEFLNVHFVSWDSDYGAWVAENRLPADILAGRSLDSGPVRIRLPFSPIENSTAAGVKQHLIGAVSVRPRIATPIWLDGDPKTGWVDLLVSLSELRNVDRITTLGPQEVNGGSVQLFVSDAGGRHLVRAFSAMSSTITYSEIEQTNTLLDTESLDSCILVTFGSLSQDAAALAARLKSKKSLTVITGTDLAERASMLKIIEQIRSGKLFDLEKVILTPLIVKSGVAVLVSEAASSAWFCVVSPDGSLLDESAELTYQIRRARPDLKDRAYWSKASRGTDATGDAIPPFDRQSYLSHAVALFDTMRYAGLAALGFRLPVDSLRKLYVPAAADVATNQASQQALKTAVDDFVEALKLDSAQRDQLEMQLRNYYGVSKSAESGAASALYQKYGAILVVGDPGSGKSCFVRNEMLSYCKR